MGTTISGAPTGNSGHTSENVESGSKPLIPDSGFLVSRPIRIRAAASFLRHFVMVYVSDLHTVQPLIEPMCVKDYYIPNTSNSIMKRQEGLASQILHTIKKKKNQNLVEEMAQQVRD